MDSKGKNYPCTFKTSLFISTQVTTIRIYRKTHIVTKSYQALGREIGFPVMYLLVYLFCYLPSLLHFRASDNLRCDRAVRCSETLAVKCQGTFPKCISTTCCKTIIQAPKCTITQEVSLRIKRLSEDVLLFCVFCMHACFCKHVIM